jgi:hypothetical protein
LPPIVTSAEIERPAGETFAYATDPAWFSEWQKGVVDGHMDGPADDTQPPAVGTKCATTRRIGGANRSSTSELVPRLTISVDFTGRGIGKILVPLVVRRKARKEMPANMAMLKQRMEAG